MDFHARTSNYLRQIDELLGKRRVHPFPARMAASIPYMQLMARCKQLRVLDPMAGSGTCVAVARRLGHRAFGVDCDPLAILISRVGCSDLNANSVRRTAERVLLRATRTVSSIAAQDAYPIDADEETKTFIRYWFDSLCRRQLTALAGAIRRVHSQEVRNALWCAFSRMIVVKSAGVSRAIDVSHSRPHRRYDNAPLRPFAIFQSQVENVLAANPFSPNPRAPAAVVQSGDARRLPFHAESMDIVITSPPYLNAIDYLRGHKLSLVWMGYKISSLRYIRENAIGAERGINLDTARILPGIAPRELPARGRSILRRYLCDAEAFLKEIYRVLVPGGEFVLVVADSNYHGKRIRTSKALLRLSVQLGFKFMQSTRRRIELTKRYLPPPSLRKSGTRLRRRMRSELIFQLQKPHARSVRPSVAR